MYQKNVANQAVGFFLSNCCGAPVTGAVVTAFRSIDGGSQSEATGAITELGNGQYVLSTSQADTNGDVISFLFTAPAAVFVEKDIVTDGNVVSGGDGPHVKDPWLFMPYTATASTLVTQNATGTANPASNTTAFFTEMDRRGLQGTTNWTADTYKTILNISSGRGLVAGYIGPTAGGASNHTIEITIDGVKTELEIPDLVSGERAILLAGGAPYTTFFTSASSFAYQGDAALDANKQVFGNVNSMVPSWEAFSLLGTPLLRFNQSLLIRAKHSASITNSTATAYSAVMYRKGL